MAKYVDVDILKVLHEQLEEAYQYASKMQKATSDRLYFGQMDAIAFCQDLLDDVVSEHAIGRKDIP